MGPVCDLDQWSNQIAAPSTTCLLSDRGRVCSVLGDTRQKCEEKMIGMVLRLGVMRARQRGTGEEEKMGIVMVWLSSFLVRLL